MPTSTLVGTGIRWLDELVGQLRAGENVLWSVDAGTYHELFVRAFLETALEKGSKAAYISFNHSPVTMKEKLGDLLDSPNFVLVDCFTDGKGLRDPIFARFYDSAGRDDLIRVERISEPATLDSFTTAMTEIAERRGIGSQYVFDSLTGMQHLWGDTTQAYRFFTYACPKLCDLKSAAYWILEKHAHPPSVCANAQHIAQVAIDLGRSDRGHTLQVVKAEGRALTSEAEAPQRYEFSGNDLRLVADGKRELVELGKLIRSARQKRGISQAELGELLGVTASTISQAENGLIALSLSNVFRVTRELELDLAQVFGTPQTPQDSASILRRKDRARTRIAGGRRKPIYIDRLLETEMVDKLDPVMVIMPPGAKLNKHFSSRKGVEFGLVLAGNLEVEVADEVRSLREGDSIYLDTDMPSGWSNPGNEEAKVLWVALR